MTDIYTRAKRSNVMSRVRGSRNASTEMRLAQLFRKNSIGGWRRNARLPGRPDFVFPLKRLAVFADGCFWHGCPAHKSTPVGNAVFWRTKLERNKARDREVNKTLRRLGWRVLRIWEHHLRRDPARCMRRVRTALAKAPRQPERTGGGGIQFLK